MGLQLLDSIDLPEYIAPGGFDHAAYHPILGRMFVAHPVNNNLDVIDCQKETWKTNSSRKSTLNCRAEAT
jgi:hypothetical protein